MWLCVDVFYLCIFLTWKAFRILVGERKVRSWFSQSNKDSDTSSGICNKTVFLDSGAEVQVLKPSTDVLETQIGINYRKCVCTFVYLLKTYSLTDYLKSSFALHLFFWFISKVFHHKQIAIFIFKHKPTTQNPTSRQIFTEGFSLGWKKGVKSPLLM